MPLVSVVMAAYNAQDTIAKAIESVQKQTFHDWELLVIDDKSTDDTTNVVRQRIRDDMRIQLFESFTNSGGPAVPRNIGMKNAKGRYIAFLDSDDQWHPEKLHRQIQFMQSTFAFISCTGYEVVDESGKRVGSYTPPSSATYADLLRNNSIGCLTAIFDTTQAGKYEFPVCGHEDYALWLSMLRGGQKILSLPESLATYNLRKGSASSNKIKTSKYFLNIYRNMEEFSFLRSVFMTVRYAILNRKKYT